MEINKIFTTKLVFAKYFQKFLYFCEIFCFCEHFCETFHKTSKNITETNIVLGWNSSFGRTLGPFRGLWVVLEELLNREGLLETEVKNDLKKVRFPYFFAWKHRFGRIKCYNKTGFQTVGFPKRIPIHDSTYLTRSAPLKFNSKHCIFIK